MSVKTIDDISRLENISLEKLFFSLHILYLENHSQFKCPLIKDRFEKIIKDYMKIDSYHSPQL